jgi:hypothetical protein
MKLTNTLTTIRIMTEMLNGLLSRILSNVMPIATFIMPMARPFTKIENRVYLATRISLDTGIGVAIVCPKPYLTQAIINPCEVTLAAW